MSKKVALIGKGYWGSVVRRYIEPVFELKYVADSKFDKSIIWDDKEVEAVIIATPIETHYSIAKEALLNGKHVLVEKPVTLTYDEAEELREIAEAKGLQICVEYTQTFSPSINECVDIIKKHGKPHFIEMSVKHLGRFMDFDVYWLLASHQLSILGMIYDLETLSFINVDHVKNGELCTTGSIHFSGEESAVEGRIDVSVNFPGKEMLITFYGESYTLKYNALAENSVVFTQYNKTPKGLPDVLTDSVEEYKHDEKNNLAHAMQHFSDVLEGKAASNVQCANQITKILEQFSRHKVG